ncbi:MAG: hypothetical protein ACR5K9_00060 [Wolbachia sp.]
MDNTITFELPINEYNSIESSYTYNSGHESVRISAQGAESSVPPMMLDHARDSSGMTYYSSLMLSGCEDYIEKGLFAQDFSINKIEIDNRSDNPIMNVELQAKNVDDIQAIKDSIKNCGFKIK